VRRATDDDTGYTEQSSILPPPPPIATKAATPTRAQRKVLAEACRTTFDEMRAKFQKPAAATTATLQQPRTPPDTPELPKSPALAAAAPARVTPARPAPRDKPSPVAATPSARNASDAAAPQQSPAKLVHTMSQRKMAARKWSSKQVTTWLEMLGLGQYSYHFAANGVDGHTLFELSREHVRDGLGIHDQRHLVSLEYGMLDLVERRFSGDVEADWEWSCVNVGVWLDARGLGALKQRFAEAAVHGGVLFRLTQEQFETLLGVGPDPLLLMSLVASVERARVVGRRPASEEDSVADWGPDRVGQWLESLSLAHLDPAFRQHAVNGSILLKLTPVLMKKVIGLTDIQAIVVERAIKKLARRQRRLQRPTYRAWKHLTRISLRLGKRLRNASGPSSHAVAGRRPSLSGKQDVRRVLKLSDMPAPAPLPGPPRRRGSSQSSSMAVRRRPSASHTQPLMSPRTPHAPHAPHEGDWYKDVSSSSEVERSLVSS